MNRKVKGIWIPIQLWNAAELTWTEKLLAAEIDSFSNTIEGCFASNEYFASQFRVSKKYVSECIAKLKSLGYVEQTGFDGRSRQLRSTKKFLSDPDAESNSSGMQGLTGVGGSIPLNPDSEPPTLSYKEKKKKKDADGGETHLLSPDDHSTGIGTRVGPRTPRKKKNTPTDPAWLKAKEVYDVWVKRIFPKANPGEEYRGSGGRDMKFLRDLFRDEKLTVDDVSKRLWEYANHRTKYLSENGHPVYLFKYNAYSPAEVARRKELDPPRATWTRPDEEDQGVETSRAFT